MVKYGPCNDGLWSWLFAGWSGLNFQTGEIWRSVLYLRKTRFEFWDGTLKILAGFPKYTHLCFVEINVEPPGRRILSPMMKKRKYIPGLLLSKIPPLSTLATIWYWIPTLSSLVGDFTSFHESSRVPVFSGLSNSKPRDSLSSTRWANGRTPQSRWHFCGVANAFRFAVTMVEKEMKRRMHNKVVNGSSKMRRSLLTYPPTVTPTHVRFVST